MVRFYGFNIEELLEMKRNYFWGLYEQIPSVKASEELDQLSITRNAYHAKNISNLASKLEHQAQGHEAVKIRTNTAQMNMGES